MVTMFKSEKVKNWRKIAKIGPEDMKDKLADAKTRKMFGHLPKGRTERFPITTLLPKN